MNRQGQMDLGVILIVFITVIVSVVLFTTAAQLIGDSTNTVTVANITFETPANGTAGNIFGKSWTSLVVYNATDDFLIDSNNYTLANNQVVNGVLTATLTPDASIEWADFDWHLSGVVEPTTYISSGGGRAIANIIVVFFALAIVVVALSPTFRNKALDFVSR